MTYWVVKGIKMSTAICRPVRLPESFLMFNFKENIGSVDQTFDILQETLILCFMYLTLLINSICQDKKHRSCAFHTDLLLYYLFLSNKELIFLRNCSKKSYNVLAYRLHLTATFVLKKYLCQVKLQPSGKSRVGQKHILVCIQFLSL